MDPWEDPPGWRMELRRGVAALAALALCAVVVPLLPVAYMAGRWSRGADR